MINKVFRILFILLYKVFGYLVIWPIARLTPKQRNLVLFIGKGGGDFTGNIKFMYAYLHAHGDNESVEYYFMTSDQTLYRTLLAQQLPASIYPSLKAFKCLLKANVAFFDTTRWQHEFKAFFLTRCHTIQLWHGPPIKEIGMRAYALRKFLQWRKFHLLAYCFIRDWCSSHYRYSVVCSPSEFYTERIFKSLFKSDHFLNSGQPRNDQFKSPVLDIQTDTDAVRRIRHFKNKGSRIIFHLPTFREGGQKTALERISFKQLSQFSAKNKCLWVLKFHTNVEVQNARDLSNLRNDEDGAFVVYDQQMDIHSCLHLADILVTDYSSVYMDFLFYDRPIIFFNYDFDLYTQAIRDLAFDYDEWTPGPKCRTEEQLEGEVLKIVVGEKDDFREHRLRVFRKAFDHHDGNASQRIWSKVKNEFITPTPNRPDLYV